MKHTFLFLSMTVLSIVFSVIAMEPDQRKTNMVLAHHYDFDDEIFDDVKRIQKSNVYVSKVQDLGFTFMQLHEEGSKQQWSEWAKKMKQELFIASTSGRAIKEMEEFAKKCECTALLELLKKHDLLAQLQAYIDAATVPLSFVSKSSFSTATIDATLVLSPEDCMLKKLIESFYDAEKNVEKNDLEVQILSRWFEDPHIFDVVVHIEKILQKDYFTRFMSR